MMKGPGKVTEAILKEISLNNIRAIRPTPDGVTIKIKGKGSKYKTIDVLMMEEVHGRLKAAVTGIAFDAKLFYKKYLGPKQVVVRISKHSKCEDNGPLMYTQELYDATGVFKAEKGIIKAVDSKALAEILKKGAVTATKKNEKKATKKTAMKAMKK